MNVCASATPVTRVRRTSIGTPRRVAKQMDAPAPEIVEKPQNPKTPKATCASRAAGEAVSTHMAHSTCVSEEEVSEGGERGR